MNGVVSDTALQSICHGSREFHHIVATLLQPGIGSGAKMVFENLILSATSAIANPAHRYVL
jgi:hypothetical protein